ncbi:MAG: efflux RND transporter periplasmic adaptor subunit [Spirosomaceae bacterium]|jgi:RND family efflux transporter MFP subunit|nr:efflux RND transporter periplasmic adaptor subunit [Spirosomataceae bacterium]
MKKQSPLPTDGGTIVNRVYFNLKWLLCLLLTLLTTTVNAQHTHADGTVHDDAAHGDHEPAAEAIKMKKSEAISERYELVLKYEHLHADEAGKLMLYVADPVTNRPISNAKINLTASLDSKAKFDIKPKEAGIYEVNSLFSKERTFALTAKIDGINGPDLMMLKGVLVGHDESEHSHEGEETATAWYQNPYVLGIGGLALGMLLMFLLMRVRNRKLMIVLLLGGSLLPTAHYQPSQAQDDGHDHGGVGKQTATTMSDEFEVPKETQFLFEILTAKVETGNFRETTQLYGTVIPASTGMAVVQTPQIGRIVSLNARVGQRIGKGQTLAVLEQTIDAGTQVNLQAERNNLEAELLAAQKEFDRLKKIEDIAAKRDLSEAEARLSKAQENLKVLNNIAKNGKGNSRLVALTAPIAGVVAPFAVAIGSTVGIGETLFTITNLSKVYVEAQVFDQDADKVRTGVGFEVECQRDVEKHQSNRVRLLSTAQMVNANQSQKMLFEVDNPDGAFKIGEYVTVRVKTAQDARTLALPNAAFNQINGKPCVFVKETPERFRVEYVATGHNNGSETTILNGLESNEKVVISSAYQLKMIFLNQ